MSDTHAVRPVGARVAGSPREELLAVVRGDPDALAAVYRRHGGEMLRLAERLLGSRSDAEDLVHDLFVALPGLMSRVEQPERITSWLKGVVVRQAVGRLRRERRRLRILDRLAVLQPRVAPAADDRPVAEGLEEALRRLPEEYRSVFVLRHLEDLTHDQIGELLGIRAGTSRTRYTRALKHLRKLMTETRK